MRGEPPVILFDGHCTLCCCSVRFVIARDPRGRFRFASLQSAFAASHLGAARGHADSIVLLEGGRAYEKSSAVLRIARGLRFPWPLLFGLIALPRPLRDLAYDAVARRRYRWFGRAATCMIPTPDLAARFIG